MSQLWRNRFHVSIFLTVIDKHNEFLKIESLNNNLILIAIKLSNTSHITVIICQNTLKAFFCN